MNHSLSLCDVEEIGKANQKLPLLVPSFLFSNYFLIFYILEKFPGHFICPWSPNTKVPYLINSMHIFWLSLLFLLFAAGSYLGLKFFFFLMAKLPVN